MAAAKTGMEKLEKIALDVYESLKELPELEICRPKHKNGDSEVRIELYIGQKRRTLNMAEPANGGACIYGVYTNRLMPNMINTLKIGLMRRGIFVQDDGKDPLRLYRLYDSKHF